MSLLKPVLTLALKLSIVLVIVLGVSLVYVIFSELNPMEPTDSAPVPLVMHGALDDYCGHVSPDTQLLLAQRYHWIDALGYSHEGDHLPQGDDIRDLRWLPLKTQSLKTQSLKTVNPFELTIDDAHSILSRAEKEGLTNDARQIYGQLARYFPREPVWKTTITMRVVSTDVVGNGAAYDAKKRELQVYRRNSGPELRRVVRHYVTHAILTSLYGHTPVWLDEGFSGYFEWMEGSESSWVVSVAEHHIRTLWQSYDAQRLPDLRAFFDVSSINWYGEVANTAERYAMSWALVYFLLSHDEGQKVLKALMKQLRTHYCHPFDSTNFLAAHYTGGLSQLHQQWLSWLFSADKLNHFY